MLSLYLLLKVMRIEKVSSLASAAAGAPELWLSGADRAGARRSGERGARGMARCAFGLKREGLIL
jgi:hypothetical protein